MRVSSTLPSELLIPAQYFNKQFGMTSDLDGLLEGFLWQATLDHPHTRICKRPGCESVIDPTFIVRDTCKAILGKPEAYTEITTEPVTTCPWCGGTALRPVDKKARRVITEMEP